MSDDSWHQRCQIFEYHPEIKKNILDHIRRPIKVTINIAKTLKAYLRCWLFWTAVKSLNISRGLLKVWRKIVNCQMTIDSCAVAFLLIIQKIIIKFCWRNVCPVRIQDSSIIRLIWLRATFGKKTNSRTLRKVCFIGRKFHWRGLNSF